MTNAQALQTYRKLSVELTALQTQIRHTERVLHPRKTVAQRYDALPGTNDPAAAAMQLLDGLESLADRKRSEIAALQDQVDSVIESITDFRLLVIIRGYYLMAKSDAELSVLLNISDRYVCKVRNGFIRNCNKNDYIRCTLPAQA